jgi:SAM-dependent methyltransferase
MKNMIRKVISEKNRLKLFYLFFKVRSVFYRGSVYYCNCCNKSFRKFINHGNIPRENAACPYCGSLERTRLLLLYLLNETDIFEPGKKILHFAPEKMLEKKFKKIKNEYVPADINPAYADVVIDITNIPYPENTFDYIICSHVLGHVPDESKAIDEMYRVLKPGGRAFILTVINKELASTFEDHSIQSPIDKLKYYGECDLVRLHGLDFGKRLMRVNSEVHEVDYRKTFSESELKRFSLGDGDRELIFDCNKLMD